MSIRSRRREATAQRIQASAQRLFMRQGFDATTMDQVAAAADVSRATLFNYYPGKGALLGALSASLEQRLIAALEHYRAKYPAAPEALECLFGHAARVLEQTAGLTRLLLLQNAGSRGFPELQSAFGALVADGQAGGSWRGDVAAESLAEILHLAFLAGLLDWCREPNTDRGEAFARRAAGLNRLLSAA